uniref:DUF2939 domain-containing protein n=1 Tax=Phenylobacterium glaciei TaxID=2803784 RepID=A0A974P651_9CAUL|nr:DUF2939 domain-containing protein [Phenylobacterium glaciei]
MADHLQPDPGPAGGGRRGLRRRPWFAFRALKADARDGDVQGLAELVDYNAVRGTLKSQLGPTPNATTAPAPTIWTDPIGAMKRALEPSPAAAGRGALCQRPGPARPDPRL